MRRLSLLILLAAVTVSVTAAANPAATPACSPTRDTTAPEAYAGRAGGGVEVISAVGTWGASTCALRAQVGAAVVHPIHPLSPAPPVAGIAGNPSRKAVDRTIAPGAVVVQAWQWRNWCGALGRFAFQARWDGQLAATSAIAPPRCVDRSAPSTLTAIRISPPACRATDVRLSGSLGQPLTGALVPFVGVALAPRRAPCLLDAALRLTIERRTPRGWRAAPVTGDPATRRLGALLLPGEPVVVLWSWRNWCGPLGAFRALAAGAGHAVAGPSSTRASRCDDAHVPSTLAPSYG